MNASLADQLKCAREVLATMRARKSRWTVTQEAIVRTVERAIELENVSVAIKGRPTEQVQIVT
jgi:hypothetical protein